MGSTVDKGGKWARPGRLRGGRGASDGTNRGKNMLKIDDVFFFFK